MTTTDVLGLLHTRIREKATTYFPHFAGRGVTLRCTRMRTGSAKLYRYELSSDSGDTPPAEIIVKLAAGSKPLSIAFDLLTLLHENRSDATRTLVVARPLDYFPDINALLTERVGGEQLSTLFLRKLHVFSGPAEREWIASRMRLCGQWLANYHRLTRQPDAAPFDHAWLERATRTIHELERVGLTKAAVATVSRMFSRLHEFGKAELAPYAVRHGAFGLQNIHVGEDWVCVFDFNDRRPDCVYEDLSWLGVVLETMRRWPRHSRLSEWCSYAFFDRRAAIAMKEHFIRGYFGSSSNHNSSDALLEGHALKHFAYVCALHRRRTERIARYLLPAFDAFFLRGFYRKRILRQCELLDRLLDSSHTS